MERGVLSAARRGKVSKKTAEAAKTLLTPALNINAAKDCDMVSGGGTRDPVGGRRGRSNVYECLPAPPLTARVEN